MNYPHKQPFNLQKAREASAERNTSGVMPKNLKTRQADYSRMIAQTKIGDGHRDATGYRRPGSNKK